MLKFDVTWNATIGLVGLMHSPDRACFQVVIEDCGGVSAQVTEAGGETTHVQHVFLQPGMVKEEDGHGNSGSQAGCLGNQDVAVAPRHLNLRALSINGE